MGGSQRFCVQCGYQLKPDSRFCVACGRAAPVATQPQAAASEQPTVVGNPGPTPTMAAPVQDDLTRPSSPSSDQTWPSRHAYHPTEPGHAMARQSFSPPDDFSPHPDSYPPPPDSYPPHPDSYPPVPDSYPPPPAEYQLPPGNYSPAPGSFSSPPDSYPPATGSYSSQPDGYQPTSAGYQPHPDSYPPQPDSYPPQPDSYMSPPAEYPATSAGFSPQADRYPPPLHEYPATVHGGGYAPDQADRRPPIPPRSPRSGRSPRSSRSGGSPHSRRSAGPSRSRRVLVLVLTLLLAAGIAAAVAFVVLRPHPAKPTAGATQSAAARQGQAQTTAGTPSPSATVGSSPAQVSEQQAAHNLAGLLGQSVKDRSSILAAVSDVNNCGPTLNQDAQTFQDAATSRQQLLSQLASLSGRSALSPAMIQDLTGAWQASEQADQDFGKWAQDEVSQGCTQNNQSDANFQAATGPDNQATIEKKAFVGQWNPVASQYGLTNYQWNQL